MHANEMQEMYAKHHKVVPNLNSPLKHKYNPKKIQYFIDIPHSGFSVTIYNTYINIKNDNQFK